MKVAVPTEHRVKLKEFENKDKYCNLARELIKLWNTRVTITPIVIAAPGTVTEALVKELVDLEIRGRVETIQTAALLRLACIQRRVLETWSHTNSSKRPSANADLKKLSRII